MTITEPNNDCMGSARRHRFFIALIDLSIVLAIILFFSETYAYGQSLTGSVSQDAASPGQIQFHKTTKYVRISAQDNIDQGILFQQ